MIKKIGSFEIEASKKYPLSLWIKNIITNQKFHFHDCDFVKFFDVFNTDSKFQVRVEVPKNIEVNVISDR